MSDRASKRRIIVAMTGATGAVYGTRLCRSCAASATIETHVVISKAGLLSAAAELDVGRRELEALGDVAHAEKDIGASIASGSFKTDGMIIAPCSMRTLAAIATGVTDNLVARAADVVLKERRRLVLLARETPLTLVHLRNMVTVTEMGGCRVSAGAGVLRQARQPRRDDRSDGGPSARPVRHRLAARAALVGGQRARRRLTTATAGRTRAGTGLERSAQI